VGAASGRALFHFVAAIRALLLSPWLAGSPRRVRARTWTRNALPGCQVRDVANATFNYKPVK
jgi:hypothetical protein